MRQTNREGIAGILDRVSRVPLAQISPSHAAQIARRVMNKEAAVRPIVVAAFNSSI